MPKLLLTKPNIDSKKHVPPVETGRVDYFDKAFKGLDPPRRNSVESILCPS